MLRAISKEISVAVRVVILLSLITGIVYPSIMTGIAQLFFVWRADGSIIVHKNKPIGSVLIGQFFTDEKYFWGRPSATSRFPYDAENSSGSNLALSNPAQLNAVKVQVNHWKVNHPEQNTEIPMELVTASGSGLDPHISLKGAYYQAARISKARNISEKAVKDLIDHAIEKRTFGFLGEPRVNVFLLNLSLDHLNEKVK